MDVFEDARESARALFEKLDQKGLIIVLAESCTGGLVSALLAANSGVSRCLAGSWVTYQDSTKTGWLGVDSGMVSEKTSVSAEVTQAMARCVLERTPGAGVSLAVTGHLEPENSPNGPFAYVAVCYRKGGHVICNKPVRFPLPEGSRVERQYRAVWHALQAARDCIDTNA